MRKDSFYCGDAAGRKNSQFRKKKDFSNSDYLFARNLKMTFRTPEDLFQGNIEKLPPVKFNPTSIKTTGSIFENGAYEEVTSTDPEAIIFCGSPGSGKSTFWQNHLKSAGYVRINQDKLKTKEKCLKVMEANLKLGKSCVIDSTNPQAVRRALFIKMA